jgi:hypothetical protein
MYNKEKLINYFKVLSKNSSLIDINNINIHKLFYTDEYVRLSFKITKRWIDEEQTYDMGAFKSTFIKKEFCNKLIYKLLCSNIKSEIELGLNLLLVLDEK